LYIFVPGSIIGQIHAIFLKGMERAQNKSLQPFKYQDFEKL